MRAKLDLFTDRGRRGLASDRIVQFWGYSKHQQLARAGQVLKFVTDLVPTARNTMTPSMQRTSASIGQ